MLTPGQINRNEGVASTIVHNPETIAQFVQEITKTRLARLRMEHTRDQKFTVEQLLSDIQARCKLQAATSLYGAIGRMARQKGLIKDHGPYVEAMRPERHANKVPQCEWVKDGVEVVKPLPLERFLKNEQI